MASFSKMLQPRPLAQTAPPKALDVNLIRDSSLQDGLRWRGNFALRDSSPIDRSRADPSPLVSPWLEARLRFELVFQVRVVLFSNVLLRELFELQDEIVGLFDEGGLIGLVAVVPELVPADFADLLELRGVSVGLGASVFMTH